MSNSQSSIVASLFYDDPNHALEWLEEVFGLELTMNVTDKDGKVMHAEMAYGNGRIMVGGTGWALWPSSPKNLNGANTQGIHVVVADLDGHCEKARAGGATISMEPEDQFYGDRTYRAMDCEGHFWTFSQPVREVSIEEMNAASGLEVKIFE